MFRKILLVILFGFFAWPLQAVIPVQSHSLGGEIGLWNGFGGNVGYGFWNVTGSVPLGLHLSFGYFRQMDSGNANEARRIFINDNQGGTIEKYGTNWAMAFNLSYAVYQKKQTDLRILGGVRYIQYSGHYAFIGDNEAFDVTSDPWGLGTGILVTFRLKKFLLLHLFGGLDYYFSTKLAGHSKYYYTPDGVDANPRTNNNGYTYNYQDADAAVDQPKVVPRFTVGLSYLIF